MQVQFDIMDRETIHIAPAADGTVLVRMWDATDTITILFSREAAEELANLLTFDNLQSRYGVPF